MITTMNILDANVCSVSFIQETKEKTFEKIKIITNLASMVVTTLCAAELYRHKLSFSKL